MNVMVSTDGNRFGEARDLAERCAALLNSHAKRLRELAHEPVMSDLTELVGLAREAEVAANQCDLGDSILRTLPDNPARLLLLLARRVGKLQSVTALSKSLKLPAEEVWRHACTLESELARYEFKGELILNRKCGLAISQALSREILSVNTKRSGDAILLRRIQENLGMDGPRSLAHLLLVLLQAGGHEIHQDVIAEYLGLSVSSIKVFISRLRRELVRLGMSHVLTARYGLGYILDEDAAAELRRRIGMRPLHEIEEPEQI